MMVILVYIYVHQRELRSQTAKGLGSELNLLSRNIAIKWKLLIKLLIFTTKYIASAQVSCCCCCCCTWYSPQSYNLHFTSSPSSIFCVLLLLLYTFVCRLFICGKFTAALARPWFAQNTSRAREPQELYIRFYLLYQKFVKVYMRGSYTC